MMKSKIHFVVDIKCQRLVFVIENDFETRIDEINNAEYVLAIDVLIFDNVRDVFVKNEKLSICIKVIKNLVWRVICENYDIYVCVL